MKNTGLSKKDARSMVKSILKLCPSGSISGVEISASGPGMEPQSVRLDAAAAENAKAILHGLSLIG